MPGIREGGGFSASEREEFARAFDRIVARLPAMFRPFWHRWEETGAFPPEIVVYAEDDSRVLRLTALASGGYRASGITARGSVIYAVAATSITEALRATGLL